MNENDLWLMAKAQGPTFLLMCAGIWYLWSRDRRNDAKADESQRRCEALNDQHTTRINDLTCKFVELDSKLIEVVKDNSQTMKSLAVVMEERIGSGHHQMVNLPNITTFGSGH